MGSVDVPGLWRRPCRPPTRATRVGTRGTYGRVQNMASGLKVDDREPSSDVPWLLVGLIVLHVMFGLVALLWHAGPAWPIAMLWSGACSMVGATIGFLFGIPRTLQGDQSMQRGTRVQSEHINVEGGQKEINSNALGASLRPTIPASNGDDYHLRVNTNLEQISDWLTKILVGVGLTQLNKVPGQMTIAASFIAKGMGDDQAHRTLVVAMLIYFPVLGFLSGYLCTRLFLQPAFRRWDRGSESEAERL